ncbi:MAG TPA: exodeoxyribonuclease III [Spirochaetes bacterium]|nr:exodeoxyribonuclease III [Spirochaetota bacterium]
MKIITLNCNGLRSASKKGFFPWMVKQNADAVCLQETRVQDEHLEKEIAHPDGYHGFFRNAEKKGYSGVALYTRREPDRVIRGLGGDDLDNEGRYIQADFGKLSIVSFYMPSGSSGEERQRVKFDFMDRFMKHLTALRRKRREYIICGDWNIAHRPIDLKNWRGNQKNSGFLPEERAWMDGLFGPAGFIDAFRAVNREADQYTWWSNRGRAWEKNVGWRIDYQVVTPGLGDKCATASIYKDERFSDHAPLIMEYALKMEEMK